MKVGALRDSRRERRWEEISEGQWESLRMKRNLQPRPSDVTWSTLLTQSNARQEEKRKRSVTMFLKRINKAFEGENLDNWDEIRDEEHQRSNYLRSDLGQCRISDFWSKLREKRWKESFPTPFVLFLIFGELLAINTQRDARGQYRSFCLKEHSHFFSCGEIGMTSETREKFLVRELKRLSWTFTGWIYQMDRKAAMRRKERTRKDAIGLSRRTRGDEIKRGHFEQLIVQELKIAHGTSRRCYFFLLMNRRVEKQRKEIERTLKWFRFVFPQTRNE